MPKFSKKSAERLAECHPDLQRLFKKVIETVDCTILCGYRGEKEQKEAFEKGHSKLEFGLSKHNVKPSLAVDVSPFPIDWNDRERFYYFGGWVLAVAETMGIKIRWGGDWNRNHNLKDQHLFDLPHFELID